MVNSRKAESFILHLWLFAKHGHAPACSVRWTFVEFHGLWWLFPVSRPLLSPPCSAEMRKEITWLYPWESHGPPGPARTPEMPFSLSSWLLQWSWHLTLPFRVICSDFGNKRFLEGVRWFDAGRAAQTLQQIPKLGLSLLVARASLQSHDFPIPILLLGPCCADWAEKRGCRSVAPGPWVNDWVLNFIISSLASENSSPTPCSVTFFVALSKFLKLFEPQVVLV